MTAKRGPESEKAAYFVGFLSWLVPGAGHWYLGQRHRAGAIFLAICVTFLLGVILGGVEMIDPQNAKAWFCAQILCGLPAVIVTFVQDPNLKAGYGRGVDWGQVYTGIAGLLNLLCVLDALARSQTTVSAREPSSQILESKDG